MSNSQFKASLVAIGIFLVPITLVISATLAGCHADDSCRPHVVSTGDPTPGLMPHATDIQC